MVDMGLQEQGRLFTANDCRVGGDESILLITGYVINIIS
jgi:DNA mismatch repair ATPase MutS